MANMIKVQHEKYLHVIFLKRDGKVYVNVVKNAQKKQLIPTTG